MKSGNKRVSSREIRDCMRKTARRIWCSGCGNGICMGSLIRAIVRLKIPQDKVAIVSGIGCSGRGSAYVDFDSIQTPHGRTIPCATGIKLIRPDMHVVVFSGDGDITAIGGNHFIHAARRNIGVTVIVVNNRIYGMTGGQVAPTTPYGNFASTAPYGHLEHPFDICVLAVGAGATYVARSTTYHVNRLDSYIEKGLMNKGFSVIEVISQCPTYYGKLNRIGSPAEMLLWLKEKSMSIEHTEGKSPEDLEGRIIMGEFIHKERPELAEEYRRLNEMVQKKRRNGETRNSA